MPFDHPQRRSGLKIAVIGSGVSGLSAAWLLSQRHDVVVYDRDSRLGGHACTVDVETADGGAAVDVGFIVYNEPAYPNLVALFDHLGVKTAETCMSFGASMRGGAVEYSGQSLSSVFARRANALSPRFLGMLVDVARFNRAGLKAVAEGIGHDVSLADFVRRERLGAAFVADFLKPMASAIWSTPSTRILDFSAAAFLKFYDNHGLLRVLNMPVWRTVEGGSRRYVERLAAPIAAQARLAAPVARVIRRPEGVLVVDQTGAEDRFDAALIATHADTALSMLDCPTDLESDVLGAFRYQPNVAYLHTDETQMPRSRRAWSSWNYLGDDDGAAVTYWMNRLQPLTTATNLFVTLNPRTPIAPEKILRRFDYEHPMFDLAAERAQRRL
ncbi:MAG: FAD-dependent oxidoreductase, partial [Parvularculaceae bacterium]|nr:FAD-dependent oxidoreductase [Parvularculaceae bacterium]